MLTKEGDLINLEDNFTEFLFILGPVRTGRRSNIVDIFLIQSFSTYPIFASIASPLLTSTFS